MTPTTGRKFLPLLYAVLIIGAIGFVTLITVLVALRAQEQTTVPDVSGNEITLALLKLQERALSPRVRLQYDDQVAEGIVISQSPNAGSHVRIGKDVNLVISRGRVLFKIDSFIGQTIEQVNDTIQTIESTYEASIQLGNVIYRHSSNPAGIVLEQSPLPDSEVGAFTRLDLVVSLGAEADEEVAGVVVPDLRNAHFESALEVLLREGIQFRFSLTDEPNAADSFRVANQIPPPGSILTDQQLLLTIHTPEVVDLGFRFGLYEYTPPIEQVNPNTPVIVHAVLPNNQRRVLIEYASPPLEVSIPYLLPTGSTLELTSDGAVLDRRIVG